MGKQMNQLLANLVVEYHKLQNFHWYVKGKDFFQVHAKLEELYNYLLTAIDEVAESILMNEGKPLASLKAYLEEATIQEASMQAMTSLDVFKQVFDDFNVIFIQIKAIKQQADQENNYLISSLMDEYIQEFAKTIWMLQTVLKD